MQLFNRKTYLPITLFVVFILFFILWATVSLFSLVNDEIKENFNSSLAIHRTISESMISRLARKDENYQDMSHFLNRLVAKTNILYIHFIHQTHTVIAGDQQVLKNAPEMTEDNGCIFRNRKVYIWSHLKSPGIDKNTRLLVVFDKIHRSNRIQDEGNLLLIILVLGITGVTFIIVSFSLYIRNRNLMQDYELFQKRRDQIEEIGLAATGLAHETKNPLGIIRGLAQQIADDQHNPKDARLKASEIMEEADITTARLGDFMSYAKMKKADLIKINGKQHLTRIAGLMQFDFDEAKINFAITVEDLNILADPVILNQIVLNLLTNSLKASTENDKISLILQKVNRQYATLIISDTGTGIPQEFLPKVFKPYSSRQVGGYGIGMAIVKKIVDESGWNIAIDSQEDLGTTVEISMIKIV